MVVACLKAGLWVYLGLVSSVSLSCLKSCFIPRTKSLLWAFRWVIIRRLWHACICEGRSKGAWVLLTRTKAKNRVIWGSALLWYTCFLPQVYFAFYWVGFETYTIWIIFLHYFPGYLHSCSYLKPHCYLFFISQLPHQPPAITFLFNPPPPCSSLPKNPYPPLLSLTLFFSPLPHAVASSQPITIILLRLLPSSLSTISRSRLPVLPADPL